MCTACTALRKFDAEESDKRKAEDEARGYEREMMAAVLAALLLLRRPQTGTRVMVAFSWDAFEQALARALVPGFAIHDLSGAAAVSGFASYDPLDLETIQRQQDYRATFLREFTAETQKAAQMAYQWSVRRGLDPETMSRLLRSVAGLNVRQTGAALAQWASRLDAGAKPKALWAALEKAVEKATKDRAKTTAESEGWRLFQLGKWSAVEQQKRKGMEFTRRWIVVDDERLCTICLTVPKLNQQGVGIDEPFRTPQGPTMMPPLHPYCRCDVEIVPAGDVS